MRAPAAGLLLKDRTADDLVAAVRAVARGEQVIDPSLAGQAPNRDR
jgi:DNA-binding NarL/FixJ family response regulator